MDGVFTGPLQVKRIIISLFLIISLITFAFGMWPKGYPFYNQVTICSKPPGIKFGMYGVAFSKAFNFYDFSSDGSFTLEVAFKAAPVKQANFKNILTFYANDSKNQLVLGQWKSWIIVMNGNDYSHSRHTPRLSFRLENGNKILFLTLVSSKKGVSLFINGRLKRHSSNFQITFPEGEGRLIFANNAYDTRFWNGSIHGIALYPHPLDSANIQNHFLLWKDKQSFDPFLKEKPMLLYTFEKIKKDSHILKDKGYGKLDLVIPETIPVFQKGFKIFRESFDIKDIVINILGFIPLGLITPIFFYVFLGFTKKQAIVAGFIYCVFVSLIIEFSQLWLPSRTSDVLDIICNSMGSIIGIICCAVLQTHLKEFDSFLKN